MSHHHLKYTVVNCIYPVLWKSYQEQIGKIWKDQLLWGKGAFWSCCVGGKKSIKSIALQAQQQLTVQDPCPHIPWLRARGKAPTSNSPYRPPGQWPGSSVVYAGEWQSVLTQTISVISPFLWEEQTEGENTHTTQTNSSKQAKLAHLQDLV